MRNEFITNGDNGTVSSTLRESVQRLIALAEDGKFLEAIETFYASSAVMQENDEPPRIGMEALLANERRALAYFKELHVKRADSFVVDGDRAAIQWTFEYTAADGHRHRLNEVAYQYWRDGKIVFEKFYYDPVQRTAAIQPEENAS
jgi:ketosteroid isomerase-like protein